MGRPRGVIRPGVNLPIRVSPDPPSSPPPGDVVPPKSKKRSRDDADSAAADVDSSEPAAQTHKKKGKKHKRERQKQLMKHLSLKAEATTPVLSRDHPFEVDAADHCETPFSAYQDIEPFLFRVALALKKPKEKLRIYDPYFCEGSVAKHLARLGFTDVYNANEDFYKVIAENRVPEHDVLLTNPPYSGDHFRKILEFCGESNKPWLLLLPNFVCRKTYYQPSLGFPADDADAKKKEDSDSGRPTRIEKPFFLIPDPLKPYRYWAPGRKGYEDRNRAKGTTPFETFWYVHMGGTCSHEELRTWWLKKFKPHSTCALPDLDEALPQQQRLQKRPNPRARKIAHVKERVRGGETTNTSETKSAGIYYDPEKAKKAAKIREEGFTQQERGSKTRDESKKKKKKPREGHG